MYSPVRIVRQAARYLPAHGAQSTAYLRFVQKMWQMALCCALLFGAHSARCAVTPEAFLGSAFNNTLPAPQALFLAADVRARVERALGHRTPLLRVRYWRRGPRTVWILDEIGKEQPITTGIQIDSGRINQVRVLKYRESRGAEVQRESFTAQFRDARLRGEDMLDRRIDGITGATLSVRALTRQARVALILHASLPAELESHPPLAQPQQALPLRSALQPSLPQK